MQAAGTHQNQSRAATTPGFVANHSIQNVQESPDWGGRPFWPSWLGLPLAGLVPASPHRGTVVPFLPTYD
ncbi:uncharacterized protein CTRU02_207440 [Colletotrichum truncatum]|uniref:Uncharacterized protein n=1 Tax=Colletotrichum truncatum TaxID=5467 RepID=A0ACC3Z0W1_COLTU|nr:uncharacterized protein CTRU02_00926 [Colletotrichum truncatum]KAF6800521.1 hypothetical protein CTRU02_00926 [Colletotrichum truncatum]